jgi:tetratricopeptide (TPR) repeat protein
MAEKNLKDYPAAEKLLERAASHGLNSFELILERGNISLAQGKFGRALQQYKKCLERSIGNPVATFNVGLSFKKLGDLDKAVKYYRRASELDPSFVEPVLELSTLYSERGEVDQARKVLESLIEAHPERREVRLALAKAYVQLQTPDEAIRVLADRLQDDALAESLRGAAYSQKGDSNAARRHLESAISKDSSLIDAQINISHIYGNAGDFVQAARHLRQGYDLAGDDALLPALSLYEARADLLDDALGHLDKVFELGQPTRDHWICRALVLERKQMWAELDLHYRAMIQNLPDLRDWVLNRTETGITR